MMRSAFNRVLPRSFSTNVVIFGAPGGGKGTICGMLVKDFGLNHISTGDLLRQEVASGSPLGASVADHLKNGRLVPDQVVVDIIMSRYDKSKSYLFDGFPRTMNQGKILTSAMNIDVVLSLDIPHETIISRLSSRRVHLASGRTYAADFNPPREEGRDDETGEPLVQRPDDQPAVIRRRLDEYDALTAPVIKFFADRKDINFKVFQGTQSKVIYKTLKPYLEDILNAKK